MNPKNPIKKGSRIIIVTKPDNPKYVGETGKIKEILPSGEYVGTWGNYLVNPATDEIVKL